MEALLVEEVLEVVVVICWDDELDVTEEDET